MNKIVTIHLGAITTAAVLLAGCAQTPEPVAQGPVCGDDLSQPAADKLSQIRQQAGLAPSIASSQLQQAAYHHAHYLAEQESNAHAQNHQHVAFSGATPGERAHAAGFANPYVAEAITTYNANQTPHVLDRATEDLMAGIYHRFLLLDWTRTEVGVSCAGDDFAAFVYKLGDSEARMPKPQDGRTALWPAPDSQDVPPVFFDEQPDPLPGQTFSGYPVSVQFNPALYPDPPQSVTLTIYAKGQDNPLAAHPLLSAANDPNGLLTPHQYALFPKQRLEWGQRYRVELSYQAEQRNTQQWWFTTKALDKPLVVLEDTPTSVEMSAGEPFVIYAQPDQPGAWSITRQTSGRLELDVEYIDPHTVMLTPQGQGSGTVELNGQRLRLRI